MNDDTDTATCVVKKNFKIGSFFCLPYICTAWNSLLKLWSLCLYQVVFALLWKNMKLHYDIT